MTPKVVGFKFSGALPTGVTATDLVLTVTEMLREHGVVGKFVEYHGAGLSGLTVADRATLSNMSPEYGATAGLFPIDDQTLAYLHLTGRGDVTELVERYAKEQGLFRTDDTPDAVYTESLELDLSTVVPSAAGPRRPQDRHALTDVWQSFQDVYGADLEDPKARVKIDVGRWLSEGGSAETPHIPDGVDPDAGAVIKELGADAHLSHGSVVIAAITSCTNTSNPSVMLGAGLLAKKAVEKGLVSKPWVKTSMAPGSRVVTGYLEGSGLDVYLDKLGFQTVGYGCTTCIGNSGPLPEPVAEAVEANNLAVVSVLSGNRNFEGRIHPQVKASYLCSPPLVVAYALAGHAEIDLTTTPLGQDSEGNDVFLKDIWPTNDEIQEAMTAVKSELFENEYAKVFEGDERWQELPSPTGALYDWDPKSTYVQEPPFFADLGGDIADPEDVTGARVLAFVGDSVTTDHISPAGAISVGSPAAKYLQDKGVEVRDFNSYGSRRGNHEVMMRGTFANIRLRNVLADGKEGGFTKHLPTGEVMTIWDAAEKYMAEGTPLIVLTGKEYGSGSSRDWAAKGVLLQNVKAVISESFERIHRSNLVGMGILPLQYLPNENAASLGLDGTETFDITGVADGLEPHKTLSVTATSATGETTTFEVEARIDSMVELEYYLTGGVLRYVLRKMLEG